MKLTKKIAAFAVAAVTAILCVVPNVGAEGYSEDDDYSSDTDEYITSGDYQYSVRQDEDGNDVAFLEKYTGSDTEIDIPETIDDYKVIGLGDGTFYENKKITEVTLSKNLTDFGIAPFYGCTSIMEFKVDEDNELYTTDSDGAVVHKGGLAILAYPTGKNPEKYTVADGVSIINASTFAMCTNLKELVLPDSLKYVGYYAFAECTSLETVVLPDNITEISNYMFSGCTSLRNVTLPKNLQKIGDAAFFNCKSLDVIDFPSTLSEIGQASFCSTGFTSITIPATISTIGYSAFGFHTDDTDQIVADENFVIMGYSGSYAQTYSRENSIEFVALDEEEKASEQAQQAAKEKTNSRGKITGICVGVGICFTVAIILTIIAVPGRKKKKAEENGENNSDNDESTEEKE